MYKCYLLYKRINKYDQIKKLDVFLNNFRMEKKLSIAGNADANSSISKIVIKFK